MQRDPAGTKSAGTDADERLRCALALPLQAVLLPELMKRGAGRLPVQASLCLDVGRDRLGADTARPDQLHVRDLHADLQAHLLNAMQYLADLYEETANARGAPCGGDRIGPAKVLDGAGQCDSRAVVVAGSARDASARRNLRRPRIRRIRNAACETPATFAA